MLRYEVTVNSRVQGDVVTLLVLMRIRIGVHYPTLVIKRVNYAGEQCHPAKSIDF